MAYACQSRVRVGSSHAVRSQLPAHRRPGDADYGVFVLVQSTLALLVSAQSAWLIGPLTGHAQLSR
jgi:hypothetical protein